jgi:TonB family protein
MAALSLHALAALGMIEYSRAQNSSENVVASVMNVNWEVEPAQAPAEQTIAKRSPTKKMAVAVNQSQAATESKGSPNPAIMENYLASLRDRLGSAIHLHQPRGSVNSQLILKVEIHSSGSVGQTKIEKTSRHPEIDSAVIKAFESLLPLSPFPEEWKKSAGSAEMITVRIPVVIKPRN